MNRKKEREFAFLALFAWQFEKKDAKRLLEEIRDINESDKYGEYSLGILQAISDNSETVDSIILKFSNNWEFSRIAVVDLSLLRIAICEFLYFSDIPPEVTMNEVIELSKIYSGEHSSKFINGILDSILEDLINTDMLNKSEKGSLKRRR